MFTLTINTENAAFEDPSELPRLLRKVASLISMGDTEGRILDMNGNTVGSFAGAPDTLAPELEEEAADV